MKRGLRQCQSIVVYNAVDVRISPDEYPTPYNVVYLEVSCPALSTRAKSADDNYALAARATPVSLLSCRRSTLNSCVKPWAEPSPIRSTAKLTRNSLRS